MDVILSLLKVKFEVYYIHKVRKSAIMDVILGLLKPITEINYIHKSRKSVIMDVIPMYIAKTTGKITSIKPKKDDNGCNSTFRRQLSPFGDVPMNHKNPDLTKWGRVGIFYRGTLCKVKLIQNPFHQ